MRTRTVSVVALVALIGALVVNSLGQVDIVRSGLTAAVGGITSSETVCPRLVSTLLPGSSDSKTNGQVSELQRFLMRTFKLNESDIVTGYYGRLTREHVQRFQEQKGISATGVVGPLTREAITNSCPDDTGLATSTAEKSVSAEAAVSTSTEELAEAAPDLPSCILSINFGSYGYGAKVRLSWTSDGATEAWFAKDTSGKDHLALPTEKQPVRGTATTHATVYGDPEITLIVSGPGGTNTCSVKVPVR